MAATVAAILGGSIISGIGNGITGSFQERTRQNEWNKMFDFKQDQFDFQKDFSNRQLLQGYDLTSRGQNLNFGGNLLNTGMSVGSSLIGNLLSYNHAQDTLNFQKEMNTQRRSDLQNEGLPLSYLHLGGLQRSVPNIPMMRTQTFGRTVSNPWGYANSGSNLREAFGPPPSYSSTMNLPTAGQTGFDQVSGYPK